MSSLIQIPFRGGSITATSDQRVALKPLCEALGLDYSGQRQRLQRTPWAVMGMTPTTGADGKTYQMVTIDRRTFTMWLATIDTSRVKSEQSRELIEIYQNEAADALDAYFHEGIAARPREMSRDELLARAVLEASDAIKQLEAELAEAQPKADTWDALCSGKGDLTITDAAKTLARAGIETGPRKLHQQLLKLGWIYQNQRKRWIAKQDRINDGCLAERVRHYIDDDGVAALATPQIRVTAKGLDRLHSLLAPARELVVA